jgi:broad specificity phosphatase PhoE
MRIGLLRHFPVREPLPAGLRTAAELQAWRVRYDLAETIAGTADLGGIAWQECLSSDLPRAFHTARMVFAGSIEQTPLLREAQFAEFATGNLRLPVWMWKWVLRFCWVSGQRSQRAFRDEFQQRIRETADRLERCERDTLVVSHAGMMAYLGAELRRRGFHGPKLRAVKHATVYIFERKRGGDV